MLQFWNFHPHNSLSHGINLNHCIGELCYNFSYLEIFSPLYLKKIIFLEKKKLFYKKNDEKDIFLEDPGDEFGLDARGVVDPGKPILCLAGFFLGGNAVQNRERFQGKHHTGHGHHATCGVSNLTSQNSKKGTWDNS